MLPSRTTPRARMLYPLAVLLCLLAVGLPVAAQEATATDEPAPGTLVRVADSTAQVFTFDAQANDTVRLTATSEGGLALSLLLTNAAGQFVAQARDVTGSGVAVLEAILPETGTYFVTVLPVPGTAALSEGSYALVLEPNPAATGEPVQTAEPTPQPLPTITPVPAVVVTPETTADAPSVVVTSQGMQVLLGWDSPADLNLEVRDPVGNTLYFDNPVTDFGGTYGNNINQNCQGLVRSGAIEQATWSPGGIPTGSYEVLVYYTEACEGSGPVDFSVAAAVDGETLDLVRGTLLSGQVYIASFEVAADGSAQMRDSRGIKGEALLPASAAVLVRDAQPLLVGGSVTGTITNDQPYQSYTFQAEANSFVSLAMNATSGSLDPYLALIDPSGNVVYFNDDAAQGVTDSALTNVLLAIPGAYTAVATRYGMVVGGTEGNYSLTVGSGGTPVPGVELTEGAQAPVTGVPAEVEALALPEGSIEVTLVWNTNADLQLLVRDPSGESVFDDAPEIRSGGTLGAAGNVGCTVAQTGTPVSYIYWPQGVTPRAGAYEIDVWFQNECNDTAPVSFTLYVTVNGQPVLSQAVTTARPFLPGEHYVTNFIINQDATVTAGEGGVADVDTLDWESEAASATPILGGDVINGSITPTNKFDLFAFDALAGDVVSIALSAAPGSILDTKLYLIGPNGGVTAENDDAVPGENRNSVISNFTLPEDGQYIIIATHYGDRFGITSGAYTLSLDQTS